MTGSSPGLQCIEDPTQRIVLEIDGNTHDHRTNLDLEAARTRQFERRQLDEGRRFWCANGPGRPVVAPQLPRPPAQGVRVEAGAAAVLGRRLATRSPRADVLAPLLSGGHEVWGSSCRSRRHYATR